MIVIMVAERGRVMTEPWRTAKVMNKKGELIPTSVVWEEGCSANVV